MTSRFFRYSLPFVLFFQFYYASVAEAATGSWKLFSPNNRICFHVHIKNSEQDNLMLFYGVDWVEKGKIIKVIEPSSLGIDRSDEQFSRNLSFVSASHIKRIDYQYQMKIGRQATIKNLANEISLIFKNEKGPRTQEPKGSRIQGPKCLLADRNATVLDPVVAGMAPQ
jgi:hypothetical protein